jgi:hypothetical protein
MHIILTGLVLALSLLVPHVVTSQEAYMSAAASTPIVITAETSSPYALSVALLTEQDHPAAQEKINIMLAAMGLDITAPRDTNLAQLLTVDDKGLNNKQGHLMWMLGRVLLKAHEIGDVKTSRFCVQMLSESLKTFEGASEVGSRVKWAHAYLLAYYNRMGDRARYRQSRDQFAASALTDPQDGNETWVHTMYLYAASYRFEEHLDREYFRDLKARMLAKAEKPTLLETEQTLTVGDEGGFGAWALALASISLTHQHEDQEATEIRVAAEAAIRTAPHSNDATLARLLLAHPEL